MNKYMRTTHAPWLSLIILLGLTLVFSVALQFAVTGIGSFSIYALLIAGTLGAFLLPALGLQYLEKYFVYFPQQQQSKDVYVVGSLFLFACGPLMQLLAKWNASLSLPASMEVIERWMKTQEESMATLTEQVVMVDSISLLLLNIVVMAVLPAIAEEFYFRGSLMQIVRRAVRNTHLTVWITAIVFSAIHLQFYGFFPRVVLGVFFGYMLVWTQNIWVPVLGHFVNNASVTVMAYYYAKQGKTYQELQNYENYPIIVYIGSIILTGLFGYWLYIRTHKENIHGERLD
ncbi:CPBP family intramembrane metalloprotease [Sphingobacterium sp. SGG-5]|uniref:CPBP family intramembrane glutamic endopeptidase n=1 Tax=Sphingobacterium sp. SGG-5 TaxID=2710881 RepID=UPI0013EC19C7|nr:type II CAAX endopeptidase family protein [Sphingobacterium sp. SGG-5]NGM60996.1 CPBP family intramembrane metalloprotease [Sphingobacterium sp. SGG-5]